MHTELVRWRVCRCVHLCACICPSQGLTLTCAAAQERGQQGGGDARIIGARQKTLRNISALPPAAIPALASPRCASPVPSIGDVQTSSRRREIARPAAARPAMLRGALLLAILHVSSGFHAPWGAARLPRGRYTCGVRDPPRRRWSQELHRQRQPAQTAARASESHSGDDRVTRSGMRVARGMPSSALSPAEAKRNASFVVLANLQSGGNIGRICRSASIFGVAEVLVVGQRKFRITGDHGLLH